VDLYHFVLWHSFLSAEHNNINIFNQNLPCGLRNHSQSIISTLFLGCLGANRDVDICSDCFEN
jgi:hypothetical protein